MFTYLVVLFPVKIEQSHSVNVSVTNFLLVGTDHSTLIANSFGPFVNILVHDRCISVTLGQASGGSGSTLCSTFP